MTATESQLIDNANTIDEVSAEKDKWIATIKDVLSGENEQALTEAKTATETAPTFVTIIMNIIKMIVTAIQSIIALF